MDISDNLATESQNSITVAHSPDNDDILMFMPIKEQLIDTRGFFFEFCSMGTDQLNQAALREEFDVTAISAAILRDVADRYYVLDSGASVGRNYGPTLVASKDKPLSEIKKVAVPGLNTTAAALVRLIVPRALHVVIPIEPFENIFDELKENRVDAAVIIHEGQLVYEDYGMKLLIDVGAWWHENHGLPLPLGVNVLSKRFDKVEAENISSVLSRSILYAVNNREALLEKVKEERGLDVLDSQELATYFDRYVNQDTLSLSTDTKEAISILTGRDDLSYI